MKRQIRLQRRPHCRVRGSRPGLMAVSARMDAQRRRSRSYPGAAKKQRRCCAARKTIRRVGQCRLGRGRAVVGRDACDHLVQAVKVRRSRVEDEGQRPRRPQHRQWWPPSPQPPVEASSLTESSLDGSVRGRREEGSTPVMRRLASRCGCSSRRGASLAAPRSFTAVKVLRDFTTALDVLTLMAARIASSCM